MAMFLQAGSPQSTWVRIMMTFINGANSEISIRTLLTLISGSGDLETCILKGSWEDLPGGPVAKNLPSTVADSGSIPTWGTKILHVVGPLNPSAATGEKTHTPQARPDAVQSRGCVPASFVTPRTVAHQTPVHGILQARILEWVAIYFSRGSS